jgi:chromosome segregation protein
VFETLNTARPYLGKHRIVTLEGEILEMSGAMTGGSSSHRSELHFGTSDATESAEVALLRKRLQDIEQILSRCGELIHQGVTSVKQLTQELTEAKAKRSETQLRLEQLNKEIKSLTIQLEQVRSLLAKNTQENRNSKKSPPSSQHRFTDSRSPTRRITPTASAARAISNP